MKKVFYCGFIFLLLSCSYEHLQSKGEKMAIEETSAGKRMSSSRKTGSLKTFSPKFPELSLDFLFDKKQQGNSAAQSQRNIAMMEEDPEVVAERKRQEEEARKKAEEEAKKAEEERKKREEELKKNPPPPQPPPINFKFIGYIGPSGKKLGIFRINGNNEDLILKRKGEKIGNDFIVVDIGYESAEIGFEGFQETKMIPLVSGGK